MIVCYRSLIEEEREGGYNVVFPDFYCCVTCGDTYEEALFMAQDVLNGYILSLCDLGQQIPSPSQGKGIWFRVNLEDE